MKTYRVFVTYETRFEFWIKANSKKEAIQNFWEGDHEEVDEEWLGNPHDVTAEEK